jgi:chromosome segregation ATPase
MTEQGWPDRPEQGRGSMTARREVPFAGDTLAWVHNEIGEIKSRLALIQQAAEQSRGFAADASEKANQARTRVDQVDGFGNVLVHLQDDLHAVRELLVRAQDDIHSLRQSREEIERRALAEAERVRQDKNEIGRRFSDIERYVEGWHEQLASAEEHNRRNLEGVAQLAIRIEALEAEHGETETLQSRALTTISRVDQEVQRLSGALSGLEREDDAGRERITGVVEILRRLEGEVEALKSETNRISRLDDRLELVQAERTRHNEQINEIMAELSKVDGRINEHGERLALTEVRMNKLHEDLRGLRERMQTEREQISRYLHTVNEVEADMRKRQIIALEKEIRDVRGRALNFGEE